MMNRLLLIFIVLNTIFVGWGQTASQQNPQGPGLNPIGQRRNETSKDRDERIIEDSFKRLRQLGNEANSSPWLSHLSRNLPEPILTKEQKLLINPSEENLHKYRDFLKFSQTGICKILFTPPCGNKLIVNVNDDKCLDKSNEELSYYSFRKRLYANLAWSDLYYEDTYFFVGFAKSTIGLIGELGDVSLQTLNKESNEVTSLIQVAMPQKVDEIERTREEIKRGISLNNLRFFDKIEVKQNQTYLLRSFAYRTQDRAFNDRRIDLVVAFRVIEVDVNRNLTIIWKELHKGKTPQV